MNIQNIVVENLAQVYKEPQHNKLYKIQLDYKNPKETKLLILDIESLKALHEKINIPAIINNETLTQSSKANPKLKEKEIKKPITKSKKEETKVINKKKEVKPKSTTVVVKKTVTKKKV